MREPKSHHAVEHVIEDGIPAPVGLIGRPRAYPWPQLEAGQSVFFPNGSQMVLSRSLSNWRKLNPTREYILRTVILNGVPGVRVWRTA